MARPRKRIQPPNPEYAPPPQLRGDPLMGGFSNEPTPSVARPAPPELPRPAPPPAAPAPAAPPGPAPGIGPAINLPEKVAPKEIRPLQPMRTRGVKQLPGSIPLEPPAAGLPSFEPFEIPFAPPLNPAEIPLTPDLAPPVEGYPFQFGTGPRGPGPFPPGPPWARPPWREPYGPGPATTEVGQVPRGPLTGASDARLDRFMGATPEPAPGAYRTTQLSGDLGPNSRARGPLGEFGVLRSNQAAAREAGIAEMLGLGPAPLALPAPAQPAVPLDAPPPTAMGHRPRYGPSPTGPAPIRPGPPWFDEWFPIGTDVPAPEVGTSVPGGPANLTNASARLDRFTGATPPPGEGSYGVLRAQAGTGPNARIRGPVAQLGRAKEAAWISDLLGLGPAPLALPAPAIPLGPPPATMMGHRPTYGPTPSGPGGSGFPAADPAGAARPTRGVPELDVPTRVGASPRGPLQAPAPEPPAPGEAFAGRRAGSGILDSPTARTPTPTPKPTPASGGAFAGRRPGAGIPPTEPLPPGLTTPRSNVMPRPAARAPSRFAGAAKGVGLSMLVEALGNPKGAAWVAGHPWQATKGLAHGLFVDPFVSLADGRFTSGGRRLLSGEGAAWGQAARNTPFLGAGISIGEGLSHGAIQAFQDPAGAKATLGRHLSEMADAFHAPSGPAPAPAPNPAPAPASQEIGVPAIEEPGFPAAGSAAAPPGFRTALAQAAVGALPPAAVLPSAMGTPSPPAKPFVDPFERDKAFRAALPPQPGLDPRGPRDYEGAFAAASGRVQGSPKWDPSHPAYADPQTVRDRAATRAAMDRYGFTAPEYTEEAMPRPAPTPAAPATPATPAAPAVDPRREELAWLAAHPGATREHGVEVYRASQTPDDRAAEAAARRQEMTRYDVAQAEIAKAGAERERNLAQARLADQGAKSPDQMSEVEYETLLRGQETPPEAIPAAMAKFRADRAAKAAGGAAGPAGGGAEPEINSANYLDMMQGVGYEGLRTAFDPRDRNYLANASLPEILDRIKHYPGLRDERGGYNPASPVAGMIREALRIRFPGEALREAMFQFPTNDPRTSGWARVVGDNMVGRGLNRGFGWIRNFNPFIDEQRGNQFWFENFARGEEYRNLLKGVGIAPSEYTYR